MKQNEKGELNYKNKVKVAKEEKLSTEMIETRQILKKFYKLNKMNYKIIFWFESALPTRIDLD